MESTKVERNAYLNDSDALRFALRAARRSLSGFVSGAADAEDMAAEALMRLMDEYPCHDGGTAGFVCVGWTKARISRRVRWLHREYTAGRTKAQQVAPLSLSLDRANGGDEEGEGAALRETLAMPKAEPVLSATGYGAEPTTLPMSAGTAVIRGGYYCRADADRFEVLTLKGEHFEGVDAWTIARRALAGSNARPGRWATQAMDAQVKHADTDARIIRAVRDAGSIAKAARMLNMNVNTAKAQYRAAQRRLAGLTTNRKRK